MVLAQPGWRRGGTGPFQQDRKLTSQLPNKWPHFLRGTGWCCGPRTCPGPAAPAQKTSLVTSPTSQGQVSSTSFQNTVFLAFKLHGR